LSGGGHVRGTGGIDADTLSTNGKGGLDDCGPDGGHIGHKLWVSVKSEKCGSVWRARNASLELTRHAKQSGGGQGMRLSTSRAMRSRAVEGKECVPRPHAPCEAEWWRARIASLDLTRHAKQSGGGQGMRPSPSRAMRSSRAVTSRGKLFTIAKCRAEHAGTVFTDNKGGSTNAAQQEGELATNCG